MTFKCLREGVYESVAHIRHTKIMGSNKINAYCPSRMQLKICSNGKVSGVFDTTHVGHEKEVG